MSYSCSPHNQWLTFSSADCSVWGLFTETSRHGAIMLFLHKPEKLWVCPHSTKACREQDRHTGTANSHIKNQTTLFMRGTTLFWENAAITGAIPLFMPSIQHCGYVLFAFVIILCFPWIFSFASPSCEAIFIKVSYIFTKVFLKGINFPYLQLLNFHSTLE